MKRRGNNEGTVSKRSDGRWMAQVSVVDKRVTFYAKTRKEVVEKMNDALVKINLGSYVRPSKLLFSDWIERWIKNYMSHSLKPTTLYSYEGQLRVHIVPFLGKFPIQDITTDIIQEYITNKLQSLSVKTVRYQHSIIYSALKQAKHNNLISDNPAENTKLPKKSQPVMKFLKPDDIKKLLETTKGDRLYASLYLALATGLRRGELLALRWNDIDLEKRTATIRSQLVQLPNCPGGMMELTPKSYKSATTILIPHKAIEVLVEHKDRQEKEISESKEYFNDNLVFCQLNGKPIHPRNYFRKFKSWLVNAELEDIRLHDIRHTFASLLAHEGVDAFVLKEKMRHENLSTTMRYIHLTHEHLDDATSKIDKFL